MILWLILNILNELAAVTLIFYRKELSKQTLGLLCTQPIVPILSVALLEITILSGRSGGSYLGLAVLFIGLAALTVYAFFTLKAMIKELR